MRVAYLDCFAGLSGDMFLGAMVDAGLDPQVLHDAAKALSIGAELRMERVDRSGVLCTKVHVLELGQVAEEVANTDSFREQRSAGESAVQMQPKTQHLHKGGHVHDHPHTGGAQPTHSEHTRHEGHSHGRSLTEIRRLIDGCALPDVVKRTALNTFALLGASEAKMHNVPVEEIHFHEVGAVDAIVDIVAGAAGMHALQVERWYCSALNVGGGTVECAHGRFPVPAPATADLLREVPTYSAHVAMELVTPTGAALLRTLMQEKGVTFGPQPAMRVQSVGYGAGSRNPKGFLNALRLSVGIAEGEATEQREMLTVLETALDDLSPQILAHVTEMALREGALDVMCTAVQMKKGRMGTLLTVLTDDTHVAALEELLLRETSTLGVRMRRESRSCVVRNHVTVQTEYGAIRVKQGMRRGEEINAAPEFEDCRSAAMESGAPLKVVMQAAIAAYRRRMS